MMRDAQAKANYETSGTSRQFDLEYALREVRYFRRHGRLIAHASERALDDSRGHGNVYLSSAHRLLGSLKRRYSRYRFEGVVLQHVDATVICPQVVYLFIPESIPHILADELDGIESVAKSRSMSTQPFSDVAANVHTYSFEP